ncbi:MAG: tRNA pseudouridine(13) synthase TruD [Deltaproteobacteria bacterium]|nr:tRNA pseudouridine(13) synthase TruD [Deltaproteobacteria bacterium]
MTTQEMLRQLAGALEISPRDLGYAGLKDARALTRQWVSLPAHCEKKLSRFNLPSLRLLDQQRHTNKLRLGHLAGNRFRLRIRKPGPDALSTARQILAILERRGLPNFFGEQRFGVLNNSHFCGFYLLRGDYEGFCRTLFGDPQQITHPAWQQAAQLFQAGHFAQAARLLPPRMADEKQLCRALAAGRSYPAAVRALPPQRLRLLLSASQSWLFDQLLSQRMPDLDRLQLGDLAFKHANGACFAVEDLAVEQQRAAAFEISPTAPLFGSKVPLAQRQPGENERALLAKYRLSASDWRLGQGLSMTGARRALRVPLVAASVSPLGSDLLLNFCLPPGSYATSVLQEIIKPSPPETASEPAVVSD